MTPQQEFDSQYITSAEICQRCEIDMSTLTAWKQRGRFPQEAVMAGSRLKLWRRNEVEQLINRINYERRSRS